MMYESPREAELSAMLGEARRAIEHLKWETSTRITPFVAGEPVTDTVSFREHVCLPIVRWRVDESDLGPREAVRIVGRTIPAGRNDLAFEYAYYVSNQALYDARDRVNILGCLHQDVMKGLGRVLQDTE